MDQRTHSPTEVATGHQLHTEILGHGDHVQQWAADGHKAVIGHHCQQEDISNYKCAKQVELYHASQEGDGFIFFKHIEQHLWHNGRGVTEIHQGQVAEEKVHGSVKSRADLNQCDHAQVGQKCDSVDQEEQQGEKDSQLRNI